MVVKHLLVIRFSSMGDIVLQTPLLSALRMEYGNHIRITFLCSKEFSSLLIGHPDIDRVLTFDRRDKKANIYSMLTAFHREYPIDMILDLHGSLRSWAIRTLFWWIPSMVVDKRRWERFFLIRLKLNLFGKVAVPQVERLLNDFSFLFKDAIDLDKLAEFVARKNPIKNKVLRLTSLTPFVDLPESFNFKSRDYLVLIPSASFANKRWPVSSFVTLAKRLITEDRKVVVLAGQGDHFCEAFNEINSDNFLNLQGKTSLSESVAIAGNAGLVIGNDTGIPHAAEAFGVPVMTFFGPTSEYFGFIPHLKTSRSLSLKMWCRPCSPTGKSGCVRFENKCLTSMTEDEVWSNIERWNAWRETHVLA